MTQQKLQKGSLLGGILLIAGSAIGGGMLGLPIVTGVAGFYPAIIIFACCWIFMTCTALLLLEVNLFYELGTNFISMTEQSLGKLARKICWITYLFLFFSMLVAYIDASGSIAVQFVHKSFSFEVQPWQTSLFFAVFVGIFVYLGTAFVDQINRFFMLGLIVTYVLLISFGFMEVNVQNFNSRIWGYSILAIPVTIASFGYHNIIPSMTTYLKKDRSKMIKMIIFGGAVPLVVYILWDWLILGVVPSKSFDQAISLDQMLQFIRQPTVLKMVEYFAFFAIVTSFLAQALALVDFLRDALKLSNRSFHRLWLVLLVLTIPYVLARLYPGLFIKALGLVGGFAAIILFVFLPVLMVWELRYKRHTLKHSILPGGKLILLLILAIGFLIVALQLMQEVYGVDVIKQYL